MPFAETTAARTYYDATGNGPALVFVHGGFVDRTMWRPQVGAFAGRYRVVAHDLRGHGRTGPTAAPRYTAGLLADDLRGLLDHLGVERAAVCGLSLGGMIAQTFAAQHPDRLAGLALCDTAAASALSAGDRLQRALFPAWAARATVRTLGVPRFVDFAFRFAAATKGTAWLGDDPAIENDIRESMRATDPAECGKIFDLIYRFPAQDLDEADVPTLLLHGARDAAAIRRHMGILADRLPRAERVEIAGAGHLPNLERPGAFNAALERWLGSVDERVAAARRPRPAGAAPRDVPPELCGGD